MHKQNRHYSLREAEYEKNYHIKQSAYINSNQLPGLRLPLADSGTKETTCVFF